MERDGPVPQLRDAIDAVDVVHARELLVCCLAWGHTFPASCAPATCDGVHHMRAIGALRVARRRLMFGETRTRDEDQRHGRIVAPGRESSSRLVALRSEE